MLEIMLWVKYNETNINEIQYGGCNVEYDVIIIGAGASGLTAAIAAARQGGQVLVIERKEKAGKKILASGNGKCNFTNMVQKPECYRSDDSAFPMKVLSCFNINKTIEFFKELGIYPKNREGYLYPNSEQALSVVQVLVMECDRLRVEFRYNETVKEITKPDFTVVTNLQAYRGKKLILATGGCASPQLGSDGSGFVLAKQLGHTIIKPVPALVQLKSPDKCCKTASGVRVMSNIRLCSGERVLEEETGEILFTDYGISGIPVMQVSRFAGKALDRGEKVQLKLDFIQELTQEELLILLQQRIHKHPEKNVEEMMIGLLNHKLSFVILNKTKLDICKKAKQLSNMELKELVKNIKEFTLPINGTNSFENAQVCAGGVSTKEINEATMESKLYRNLYLIGEVVDVDGTCGGYNLQWAWSSGYVAGTAAGSK